MNTEVALIETTNAMEIFTTTKGLDPVLDKIRQEIDMFVPDLETAKGRKEIASMARKVSSSKSHLDKVGKELVDELKKQPKLIDAERKRVKDILDQWRDEVRLPLTNWENAEKDRVAKHQAVIDSIKEIAALIPASESSRQLDALFTSLNAISTESLEEFKVDADNAKNAAIVNLHVHMDQHKEREQAERLEQLRLEKEAEEQRLNREEEIREQERLRVEREEKEKLDAIKAEAALREQQLENEKRQAELDKQKAEQDRIDAEKKAKEEAERAESDRIESLRLADEQRRLAAEKAEQELKDAVEAERKKAEKEAADREAARVKELAETKAAEDARQADLEHRKKINNKILEVLTSAGIAKGTAKQVITLAASDKAHNLKVIY